MQDGGSNELTNANGNPDGRRAEIHRQLEVLQRAALIAPRGKAAQLLGISLLLFIASTFGQWDWKYLIIVIPVLFLHELGHFLAMRAFQYRNLRMFFIPFFGAAATGQNQTAPGWKKVIVSLAGPLPGVLAGLALSAVGFLTNQAPLLEIGLIALVLNAFNLLPILPLDGGWIIQTLLFCRSPVWEALFRLFGVAALFLLAQVLNTKILVWVALLFLIGVPFAYRRGSIAVRLRKQGIPPVLEGERIPAATADAIIDQLRPSQRLTEAVVARQVLGIFEKLNQRPPTWLATVGLGFAYGLSLVLGLGGAALFLFLQRFQMDAHARPAGERPEHVLVCSDLKTIAGTLKLRPGASATTIVATFQNKARAEKGWRSIGADSSFISATWFGDSILLSLPAENPQLQKKWENQFKRRAKEFYLNDSASPVTLSLSITAASQEDAAALEESLKEYFECDLPIVPPWQTNSSTPPERKTAQQAARKTYLAAQNAKQAGYSDPEVVELQREVTKARRGGDEAQTGKLALQMNELIDKIGKERLEKLASGAEGPVEKRVMELFKQISDGTGPEGSKSSEELAELLGKRGEGSASYSATGGKVSRNGAVIELRDAALQDAARAAPALVQWLCGLGATKMSYDLQPSLIPP